MPTDPFSRRNTSAIGKAAEAARRLSGAELDRVRAKVADALKKPKRGRGSPTNAQHRKEAQDAIQRYARHGTPLGGNTLKKLGPLGRAIEVVLGGIKRSGVTPEDIAEALSFLQGVAPEILAPIPKATPVSAPQRPKPFIDPNIQVVRASTGATFEMRDVGSSSNVHSYGYNPDLQILRVVYLASSIKSGGLTRHKKSTRGRLGGTIGRHRAGPGPVYDYYNVPPTVFSKFEAAGSKGGAVWDLLRVRGTIEGHQYQYALVQGGASHVVDEHGRLTGERMVYVPRRAVQGGFVERKRQGIMSSILPTQLGPGITRPRPPGRLPNDGSRGLYGW